MNLEIAIIKWIDSTYYAADFVNSDEEISFAAPKFLITVGTLLLQNEDFVVICQDFEFETKSIRKMLSIPRCSISKMEVKKIKLPQFKDN